MREIIDSINALVKEFLENNATPFSKDEVISKTTLNPRAITGPVYVGEEFIAVHKHDASRHDRYAGFEYISGDVWDDRVNADDYVFYTTFNPRARDLRDALTDTWVDPKENDRD